MSPQPIPHINLARTVSFCRAAMQGAACFDGLAPLRDHLIEVELLDVTLPRGALGLGSPAAAIAQSLSRVLRPERLTIRATPGGPSPMLMHGAEGPGPALEFGAMLTQVGDSTNGVAAPITLEEGGLFTRLRSLEVRVLCLLNPEVYPEPLSHPHGTWYGAAPGPSSDAALFVTSTEAAQVTPYWPRHTAELRSLQSASKPPQSPL